MGSDICLRHAKGEPERQKSRLFAAHDELILGLQVADVKTPELKIFIVGFGDSQGSAQEGELPEGPFDASPDSDVGRAKLLREGGKRRTDKIVEGT